MTSIFVKIEEAVVSDAEAAVADLEQFFTQDVWPVMKSVLTYIEQNGASDLITIAKNALNATLSGLETGTAPEQVAAAVVGTVVDEAKSAGLQIAQGAATLAVSMAAAAVNQSAPNASSNASAPVEGT
jgi:hypothetical protein